jgi:hypothetical protein
LLGGAEKNQEDILSEVHDAISQVFYVVRLSSEAREDKSACPGVIKREKWLQVSELDQSEVLWCGGLTSSRHATLRYSDSVPFHANEL